MSTVPMRATLALLGLLLISGMPRIAGAQEKRPDYKAARQHFKAAQRMMAEKRYADAIVAFRKAYDITGDGLVMGQVALAYEKAGDYEGALKALAIYRDALPAADRGPTDKLMAQYRKAIAEGRSHRLVLPGEAAPKKPAEGGTLMDAFPEKGKGKASGEADEARPAAGATTGAGPGAATHEGGAEGPVDGGEAAAPQGRKRFWTWIALGTSGAMALSALVVGLNAQNKFDELESTCKPNCDSSEVDAVRTRALAADVLWGAAATALVTAGILYFFEGRGGGEASARSARKGLTLSPLVGAGATVGLGAEVRY